jgi:hypothetical protein
VRGCVCVKNAAIAPLYRLFPGRYGNTSRGWPVADNRGSLLFPPPFKTLAASAPHKPGSLATSQKIYPDALAWITWKWSILSNKFIFRCRLGRGLVAALHLMEGAERLNCNNRTGIFVLVRWLKILKFFLMSQNFDSGVHLNSPQSWRGRVDCERTTDYTSRISCLNLTSLFASFVFLLCRLRSGAFTIDSSTQKHISKTFSLKKTKNEEHF